MCDMCVCVSIAQAGEYADGKGWIDCKMCGPGTFTDFPGLQRCTSWFVIVTCDVFLVFNVVPICLFCLAFFLNAMLALFMLEGLKNGSVVLSLFMLVVYCVCSLAFALLFGIDGFQLDFYVCVCSLVHACSLTGQYQSASNATFCLHCPNGTYADAVGTKVCKPCGKCFMGFSFLSFFLGEIVFESFFFFCFCFFLCSFLCASRFKKTSKLSTFVDFFFFSNKKRIQLNCCCSCRCFVLFYSIFFFLYQLGAGTVSAFPDDAVSGAITCSKCQAGLCLVCLHACHSI